MIECTPASVFCDAAINISRSARRRGDIFPYTSRSTKRQMLKPMKDDAEGLAAGEASGVKGGAQGGVVIRRRFGAEALRHLALDHGGPRRALAAIVGRLDLARKIAEGQQLVTRPGDLGQEYSRDRAGRRRFQNVVDPALQRTPLGPHS